jgi:hypothetical protein
MSYMLKQGQRNNELLPSSARMPDKEVVFAASRKWKAMTSEEEYVTPLRDYIGPNTVIIYFQRKPQKDPFATCLKASQ